MKLLRIFCKDASARYVGVATRLSFVCFSDSLHFAKAKNDHDRFYTTQYHDQSHAHNGADRRYGRCCLSAADIKWWKPSEYSESNIVEHMIKGHENPLIDWKTIFGSSSEPTTNAADYPAWADVRAKADEVQKNTLAFIDSLTDADLDNPSKNPPPGKEDFFGTVGACLLVLTLHPVMHRGQVADARRMVNRAPVLG